MTDTATFRETKYCNAIRRAIRKLDHTTNNELLTVLRKEFPELSATTVHRATTRLAQRGEIGVAPATKKGAIRYDAQATPHDHFSCTSCDRLCDATIRDMLLPIIEKNIQDCSISGNVVITGICKDCSSEV